jgi:hypothetical protein
MRKYLSIIPIVLFFGGVIYSFNVLSSTADIIINISLFLLFLYFIILSSFKKNTFSMFLALFTFVSFLCFLGYGLLVGGLL